MHEVGVVAVHADQLPVAQVLGLVEAGIQEDLARWRRIHQHVELRRGATQELGQRLTLRLQAGEQESAVGRHPGHLGQAHLLGLEIRTVAARLGHLAQRASQVIDPAVVPAPEHLGVAGFGFHHGGAAMPAAVDQHTHLGVPAADHQHGRAAHPTCLEVAGTRNFTFVTDIDPRPVEDALHLQVEDRLVGIDARVNPAVLHQRGNGLIGGGWAVPDDGRLRCAGLVLALTHSASILDAFTAAW